MFNKRMDGTMKVLLMRYLTPLILLGLIINCNQKTDLAIRYDMEKNLNEADRLQEQFAIKGDQLSDTELNQLIVKYLEVAEMAKLPSESAQVENADEELKHTWELAMLSYTRVGALYYDHRKMYDKSYDYFEKIIDTPASRPIQKGAALNYMASCREKSGRYKEAATIYKSLADNYPEYIIPDNPNIDALNAPIKVAEMWQIVDGDKKYFEKLETARKYYNKLLPKYPGSPFEAALMGKIVGTYLRENRFNEAVNLLEDTKNDSTGLLSPRVMMILADIYIKNIHDFRKAEKVYRKFLKHYSDNNTAGQMTMGLGLSLYEQGKFSRARKAVKDIEKVTGVRKSSISEAYFLTALCYEKEGTWARALNQFNLIQATFAGTEKAFEAGLYVANYYRSNGKTKLANSKFQETIDYIIKYTNPETSNPLLAARAFGYLARTYTEMGNLDKTIETMETVFKQYPRSPEGRLAPLRIADLYENEKKDYQEAAIWLRTFIDENPGAGDTVKIAAHIQTLVNK